MANNKKQEAHAIYDEASLKTFVLTTLATNEATTSRQLDSILTNASQDSAVFRRTITYLETPFSNPNSSYRNQNLNSKLLQSQIKSKWYGSFEKEVAAGKLKLLHQNNVGGSANDFTYSTRSGNKKRMYDTKSPYTLLYFYNPECPACKEMITAMESSSIINNKIKTKDLSLLAIYIDKDPKIWLNHLREMPSTWLHGRDDNEYLYKNNIYDLHAIPTLYLVDSTKTVLLKDITNLSILEQALTK
jgi:thiol-disulfide isomerase/thioredoxin